MKDIVISIIVPVYKVEKQLKRCLNSLVEQDYVDKEIILIDDGSPDGCGNICDEYERKYECVKVIHQDNKGLAYVRNLGIAEASGQYISFIDSDDYVLEGLYSHCYELIKKFDADIICFGQQNIYGDESIVKREFKKEEKTLVLSSKEAMDQIFFEKNVDVITCNKIIKKEILKGIEYPIGLLYEDMFTTYKIIARAKEIVCTDREYYIYCHRPESIGGMKFSKQSLDLLRAVDETYNFAIEYCDKKQYIDVGYLYWNIIVINMMIRSKVYDIDLINKVKKLSGQNRSKILKCDLLSKSKKCELILIGYSYNIYRTIYMLYIKKFRNYELT